MTDFPNFSYTSTQSLPFYFERNLPVLTIIESTTPGRRIKMREEFLCRVLFSTSFSVYINDAIILIDSKHFTIVVHGVSRYTARRWQVFLLAQDSHFLIKVHVHMFKKAAPHEHQGIDDNVACRLEA